MVSTGVSFLKFVGTVSLGLLTGVSYTVSNVALPTILRLPSSSSASAGLSGIASSLKVPVLTLTALASTPFLLCYAFSSRSGRHPYLLYTSLFAVLSSVAPSLVPQPTPRPVATKTAKASSSRSRMEASYEVLGDAQSDAASEEDIDDVNAEEVRVKIEGLARGYVARTSLAALGFAMAVVGIWGDGAPQAVVYVS